MSTHRTLVEQLGRSGKPAVRPRQLLRCTHCGGPVDPFAPGAETTVCQSVACFDAAFVAADAAVAARWADEDGVV